MSHVEMCGVIFSIGQAMSSSFFANAISLLGFGATTITLIVGGKEMSKKISEKATEILREFKARKRNAIFGYHQNLGMYVLRVRRLVSDNQGNPMRTLYFLSSEESLRERGNGYETLAGELLELSRSFLDYLSSQGEQIPAAANQQADNEWRELMRIIASYLSDFLLLRSKSYLPRLSDVSLVEAYHRGLILALEKVDSLLNEERESFWKEQKNLDGSH